MTTEKIKTTVKAIEKLPTDFAWLISCPDCDGYGYNAGHGCSGNIEDCESNCPIQEPCERCHASGNAPLFTKAELTSLASAASRCLEFEAMVERAILMRGFAWQIERYRTGDKSQWFVNTSGDVFGPFESFTEAYAVVVAERSGDEK